MLLINLPDILANEQIARRMPHLADWEAEVGSKVTELPQGENKSAEVVNLSQLKLKVHGEGASTVLLRRFLFRHQPKIK